MEMAAPKPPIYGETLESLSALLKGSGHAAFRAKQILAWLYRRRASAAEEMTDLPKPLRQWLDETFDFEPALLLLEKKSEDVTQKLLMQMRDEALVECVLIRAPQEGEALGKVRTTVCISTQVGCAHGCRFCASGMDGFRRNLSAGEIVAQVMHAVRLEDEKDPAWLARGLVSFDNLVVMGMGEPLANYDNVIRALTILNASWGLGLGARRITLSTSGVAPKILELAKEELNIRLALSLHGATDEVRSQIMPVNRRYPLKELLVAVRAFSKAKGHMVTLEYIMIDGVNDTPEQARELIKIAKELHAHVNLIPYNTVQGLEWRRSPAERRRRFAQTLKDAGVSTTLRKEKGHDIDAACGQLRLKTERARVATKKSL